MKIVFMVRCQRCGSEESNSVDGESFPSVCRHCGAYGGDLTPFLLVGEDSERYVFERPAAVGGSLVLLTTGHTQFVAIDPVTLAELIEDKINEGGMLKLSSSTNSKYVGFINPLEVAGIVPKPSGPGAGAGAGAGAGGNDPDPTTGVGGSS